MEHRERENKFTEVMSSHFVEALEDYNPGPDDRLAPHPSLYKLQRLVASSLMTIDWPKTGLTESMPYDMNAERYVLPREHAKMLTDNAFADTLNIVELCEAVADEQGLQDGVTLGDTLLRSSHSMLIVSKLIDNDKTSLLQAAAHPEKFKHAINLTEEPGPVVLNSDRNNQTRFEWSPKVTDWIEERSREGYGCPANKLTIEDSSGHKHLLIYFFWDKLIEASYPVEVEA